MSFGVPYGLYTVLGLNPEAGWLSDARERCA